MAGEDVELPIIFGPLSKTYSFRDSVPQWQARMLKCPSSLAHCRQPTQDRMLILCRLWQFSDSWRCTWPSILALLWPKNDLSWLLPCAPPPAGFTFLLIMRKHFHVHDSHEIKMYRCRFH